MNNLLAKRGGLHINKPLTSHAGLFMTTEMQKWLDVLVIIQGTVETTSLDRARLRECSEFTSSWDHERES